MRSACGVVAIYLILMAAVRVCVVDVSHHLDWIGLLIVTLVLLTVFIWRFAKAFYRVPNELQVANNVRIRIKLYAIGFMMTLMVGASYFLAAMNLAPVGEFCQFFIFTLPISLPFCFLYLRWEDARIKPEEDKSYQFGLFLVRQRPLDYLWLKTYLLGWIVKIFFVPLMISALLITTSQLLTISPSFELASLLKGLFVLGVSIDLVIACCGYLATSRFIGYPVISVDDTVSGWFVCMLCYPPFVYFLNLLRQYESQALWSDLLPVGGALYWIWGVVLGLSWVVYWSATFSFGLKFSNLSWRGLVKSGPYAYTKHPAYVAKNIYWWFYSFPFLLPVSLDVMHQFFALALVSFLYYLRAKTEERHLMRFPEYKEYATYIEQWGVFSKLRRVIWPRTLDSRR